VVGMSRQDRAHSAVRVRSFLPASATFILSSA
jgi:hypothetical protein